MTVYDIYGLAVDCAVDLPHDRVLPQGTPYDVRISRGGGREVSDDLPPVEALAQAVTLNGRALYSTAVTPEGGHTLTFHGRAQFEISPDLRHIVAHAGVDCDDELLSIFVTGTVLAVRAVLAGELFLHASAVERGGAMVAFVAPSGVGKSTLAALCSLNGAGFVTDDVLRLDLGGPDPMGYLGASENRLRREASVLSRSLSDETTRRSIDGRTVWAPPASTLPRSPLRAVVLPLPRKDVSRLSLTRLSAPEALVALAGRPRVLGWREPVGRRRSFGNLGQLVAKVPVYSAVIPWGPPFDPAVTEELLATLLDQSGS